MLDPIDSYSILKKSYVETHNKSRQLVSTPLHKAILKFKTRTSAQRNYRRCLSKSIHNDILRKYRYAFQAWKNFTFSAKLIRKKISCVTSQRLQQKITHRLKKWSLLKLYGNLSKFRFAWATKWHTKYLMTRVFGAWFRFLVESNDEEKVLFVKADEFRHRKCSGVYRNLMYNLYNSQRCRYSLIVSEILYSLIRYKRYLFKWKQKSKQLYLSRKRRESNPIYSAIKLIPDNSSKRFHLAFFQLKYNYHRKRIQSSILYHHYSESLIKSLRQWKAIITTIVMEREKYRFYVACKKEKNRQNCFGKSQNNILLYYILLQCFNFFLTNKFRPIQAFC
jgi:hypothetical protein